MKTLQWLIATLSALLWALFVLQSPLCALSCSTDAELAPAAASKEVGDSPCHGQSSGNDPADSKPSHDDCGCGESYAAILTSVDHASTHLEHESLTPPRFLDAYSRNLVCRIAKIRPQGADFTPPDILLLKSSLLI